MAQTTNLRSEFLDKAEKRLKELKPQVEEFHQLEKDVAALKGGGAATAGSTARRGPGRPRGSQSGGAAGSRRGRPGKRAQQVLAQVKKNPGITIPELASKLKMDKPAYLYKVVPDLVKDGSIKKDGRGYKSA